MTDMYKKWEDKDFCLNAIALDRQNLHCVPFRFWSDKDFCLESVKRNVEGFEWIRDEDLTTEMCLIAVGQNRHYLGDVPKNLMSEDVIMQAVKNDGLALAYVPKLRLTRKIIETAVRQNREALQHVPDEWREEAKAAIIYKEEQNYE